jgi:hypothetical protein
MTGKIYAQGGDDLSEQNINEAAAIANQSDYVVRGLGLTADYANLELDVSAGMCTILYNKQLYRVFPDAVTKQLISNETNEIFVRIDPSTQDDVSIAITTDGSTPTDPHLKIGEVDTVTNSKTETNRNPDADFVSADVDELNNVVVVDPADGAAGLENAFAEAGTGGNILVKPGGTLSLNKTVTFDLSGDYGFSFQTLSPIQPDAGIGNAIEVVNGYPNNISCWFRGGGQTADYSLADPSGADQALFLRGIRGVDINIRAADYSGRVVRMAEGLTGEPKTSKITFENFRTDNVAGPCGQALYCDVNGGAALEIGNAYWFFDDYGPIFRNSNDILIDNIDGGWQKNNGLIFDSCSSVNIDKASVGDETQTITLIKVVDCDKFGIANAYCLGGNKGLLLDGFTGQPALNVGKITTKDSGTYGVEVDGSRHWSIQNHQSTEDDVGMYVDTSGVKSRFWHYQANIRRPNGSGIILGDDADRGRISGVVREANQSGRSAAYGVDVQSTGSCVILDTAIVEGTSTNADLNVVSGNDVRVIDGLIPSINGTPNKTV